MSKLLNSYALNLQLFAEGSGGDGGTGADGANGVSAGAPSLQSQGVSNAQSPDVRSNDDGVDRNAEFEALIKGKYKDLYDARIQDTIQKRLKSSKETVDKYNALTPTLEMLSRKYGVDAQDITALNKAIEDDDAYYEDEAMERGLTVEQLKSIKKMERENAELKRQMEEAHAKEESDRIVAGWLQASEQMKSVYPSFNLQAELQNPNFAQLLRNNIDVRTAYEVIHKDEIIPAAMQFAVNTAEQKLAKNIMANGSRPKENGLGSQSSVLTTSDVSKLTKEQRAELALRASRGERITFR